MSSTPSLTYFGGHVADLAERLRAARAKHGVNAVTAARLMGMRPQRVSALELGRVEAKARDVALYARLLGVDAVELLMGDEREPIEVPDVPGSWSTANGSAGRARSLAARQAAHMREPRPSQVAPAWRPAGLGRDARPAVEENK